MTERVFTAPDAWLGGFYDVAFLYPSGTPPLPVLTAIWSFRDVHGPVAARDVEPDTQPITDIKVDELLRGVMRLPGGKRVACVTWVVDSDRLDVRFSLVMGSLVNAWPEVGGFPFVPHESAARWEPRLEPALVELSKHVHARVPFTRGLVGFEGIGFNDDLGLPGPIPDVRGVGILDVNGAEVRWWPPTIRGGMKVEP